MATKPINLQENFLNQARKENVPVTIHLVNGFQIKGMIRGFDQFTVVIDAMGRQQMVFKHAISTITPSRPLGGTKADEKPAEVAAPAKENAEVKAE
ncbi:MAG: RNA chaperone Hfq [Selenomonadaceae bacterium]|nr:RNA chaperone Hfq [Selenomonadaceae bacterium]MBQ4405294.1 RNA chaperone Hfq [Selenomonadaceae bacterium]MBQ6132031.1 RNA chaperone Hfq [Selenomonadaceae bacterium]